MTTAVTVEARDVPRGVVRDLARIREQTTFHEAGHALIPLLRDVPVEHAIVGYEREELSNGAALWQVTGVVRTGDEYDNQLGQEGLAILTAAGSAAEAEWTRRREGGNLDALYREAIVRNSDDNKYLMRHVADGGLTIWAVLDQAMDVVRREWWRITHIARELDREGRLDDRQLRRAARW